MANKVDKYADYVEHPRYGRGPKITGLNPKKSAPNVYLHWNTSTQEETREIFKSLIDTPSMKAAIDETFKEMTGGAISYDELISRVSVGDMFAREDGSMGMIPKTAIKADLSSQTSATISVTHYFDIDSICRDCRKPFIFFALEQKYWYEELGFGLDSGCVRCVNCRKVQQELLRDCQRYEELLKQENRDSGETIQLAELTIDAIEAERFTKKKLPFVRMLVKQLKDDTDEADQGRCERVLARVVEFESRS